MSNLVSRINDIGIDEFNNGATFDMAALNNNSQEAAMERVYTDTDSSLVFEVKEYLNNTDTLGVSSIITSTSTTTDTQGNSTDDTVWGFMR